MIYLYGTAGTGSHKVMVNNDLHGRDLVVPTTY